MTVGATGDSATSACVAVPYNDYGTYPTATMMVGEEAEGGTTQRGFRGVGTGFGGMSSVRFACCPWRREVDYRLVRLDHRYGDGAIEMMIAPASADYAGSNAVVPADPLMRHVADAMLRLDALDGREYHGLGADGGLAWCWRVDEEAWAVGAEVPVRITGRKHPVVTEVAVVSEAARGRRNPARRRRERCSSR